MLLPPYVSFNRFTVGYWLFIKKLSKLAKSYLVCICLGYTRIFLVRIPAPYIGWTFFTFICCKNCIVCLKKTKNKRQRGRGWPIFLKKNFVGREFFEDKTLRSRTNGLSISKVKVFIQTDWWMILVRICCSIP